VQHIIGKMSRAARRRAIYLVVAIVVIGAILYARVFRIHPHHSSSKALEGNSPAGETLWLTANGLRLKTRIYRSARVSGRPVLVIVLHGDSPFHPPSYQYIFARRAAEQIDDLVAAAILRPGYTDDAGDTSAGKRGETTGDNYTPQAVDAVADATKQLEEKFGAGEVIVAGHSGGAAIAGDLIGRDPGLADGALLVSCPCDVPAFRKHMAEKQMNPMWLVPVESLSPLALVGSVAPTIHVRMLVGTEDTVAPPALTGEYAAGLRARGIDVRVMEVPGEVHDMFLDPVVFEQLKELAGLMEGASKS